MRTFQSSRPLLHRLFAVVLGSAVTVACGAPRSPSRQEASNAAPLARTPQLAPVAAHAPARVPSSVALGSAAKLFDFADLPLEREVLPPSSESLKPEPSHAYARAALDELQVAVRGLPAAPRRCQTRAVAIPRVPPTTCSEPPTAFTLLADALAEKTLTGRDRKLWLIESCSAFPRGLIRALRAELDPTCGDAIIAPFLGDPKQQLSQELTTTLLGLAYAARLQRAVTPIEPLKFTKRQEVLRFLGDELVRWREVHTSRLNEFASRVERIPENSYGRAVATLALSSAFHDVVLGARRAPIPEAFRKDYELRTLYYGGSDEALAPAEPQAMKTSLVAANLASHHGIVRSFIVNAWHRVTARLPHTYPSVLGELLLPVPPAYPTQTAPERVASALPSYYAGMLYSKSDLENPRVVRGLIENGLALQHRVAWAERPPNGETAVLLTYGRVRLARRTFQAIHFDEAIRLLHGMPDGVKSSPELRLLLAVSVAARTGPRQWERLWDKIPITRWEALRDLGEQPERTPMQSFALFDEGLLRSLGDSEASNGLELARLFERARVVSVGTDAEPCIESRYGYPIERHRWSPAACTLLDPL